jgi:hypothetical protein
LKKEGFNLLHVFAIVRQIDGKVVPIVLVTITKMRLQPTGQLVGESNVIERALPIEGVNARLPSDQIAHNIRMRYEQSSGDMFKVLKKQGIVPCSARPSSFLWHVALPSFDSQVSSTYGTAA